MRNILAFVLTTLFVGGVAAQETVAVETVIPPVAEVVIEGAPVDVETNTPQIDSLLVLDAAETSLSDFKWIARPVVIFADNPADPRFAEQLELLLARPDALIARDVIILTDTDPAARSDVRLKLRPRGFMLTLIDKDGTVNLRKPSPWDVREISRAIDKMPSRQQEIREKKEIGG